MPRATGLTGTAGEYFVAAELSLRGWLATVTVKNAPGVDVLAMSPSSSLSLAIQTKTASSGKAFTLTADDQRTSPADAQQWYVFVGLNGDPAERRRPDFYVMPRNAVAVALYLHYEQYLAYGGKETKRRSLRRTWAPAPYRERWDLLEGSPPDAVALLPKEYRDMIAQFGLPPELDSSLAKLLV